jgi:hypothetical protein
LPDRVHEHRPVAPTPRVSVKPGYFFPGEAARILKLDGIDYHQLRLLLKLVRGDAPEPRKWARYDLRDLAGLKLAIELAGGLDALRLGRHLNVDRVRRAAEALRAAGINDPFVQVNLFLERDRIMAATDGLAFDATTGQIRLDFVNTAASEYLERAAGREERKVIRRIMAQDTRRRQRPRSRPDRDVWKVDINEGLSK